MPVVEFHLIVNRHTDEALGRLLVDASLFYASTLYPDADPVPLDRVRAFVSSVAPGLWATAGVLVRDGGEQAPYFTCLVLAGRPSEQRRALLAGFTDLIVRHLDCLGETVRGQVIEIDPENWGIGGVPASEKRRFEVDTRRRAAT